MIVGLIILQLLTVVSFCDAFDCSGMKGCIPRTVGGNASNDQCKDWAIRCDKHDKNGDLICTVDVNMCTTSGKGGYWCTTTDGYSWGYCPWMYTESNQPTIGGNANGARCKFPFRIGNQVQYDCVRGNNNAYICATTYDYNTDRQWGICHWKYTRSRQPTEGGNANGERCVFPFQYRGYFFSGCITEDANQPWCYTTHEPHNDGKFGYCWRCKRYFEKCGNPDQCCEDVPNCDEVLFGSHINRRCLA